MDPKLLLQLAGTCVLGADGHPLKVYHWTHNGDFETFEHTNDIGFHFGSLDTAEARARQVRGMSPAAPGERIICAHLMIKRALELPDLCDWNPAAVINALSKVSILTDEQVDRAWHEIIDRDWVRAHLAAAGYDGIRYPNSTEGGGESWIALTSDQVHIIERTPLNPET